MNFRIILHGRNFPRLRTVGDKTIGEQHDRGHPLQGYSPGLECHVEAIAGALRRHHNHGALPITAIENLKEVCLLRFCR